MGKSIRSKRKKRLRTIKREIVVPHYELKEQAKFAVQEAALAAPKIELPQRRQGSEENPIRGRAGSTVVVPMSIENEGSKSSTDSKLKPTRLIGKRGKSRKRDLSSKRKKSVKF
ncbi:unnamed protein product [Calypogeia fissa]